MGAPDPPEDSSGLLAGGRTLGDQGLTTHQEPAGGDEEEKCSEEELKERIREMRSEIGEAEADRRIGEDCMDCGEKVEELEMCLLGLDVTALFPSMSAKRTGEIVRRRMTRSRMKLIYLLYTGWIII